VAHAARDTQEARRAARRLPASGFRLRTSPANVLSGQA
jgi:hypothetical protein